MVERTSLARVQSNPSSQFQLSAFSFQAAPLSSPSVQIHCCYTPAHAVLFERHFRPSLPAEFELHSTEITMEGAGDFLDQTYMGCLRKKLDLIIESIRSNPGEIIVWSDVDLLFFRSVAHELTALLNDTGKDILYQRESTNPKFGINGGFFVCRCSGEVENFYKSVRLEMDRRPRDHDQTVINAMLSGGEVLSVKIGYLPLTYYARTHGWPPPRDSRIYHANYTMGVNAVGQKVRQFVEAERAICGSELQRLMTMIRVGTKLGPASLLSAVRRRLLAGL